MKYRSSRREICRFEEDELLYRVYFFEDGEIAFTVTGDNIRLGLFNLIRRSPEVSIGGAKVIKYSAFLRGLVLGLDF